CDNYPSLEVAHHRIEVKVNLAKIEGDSKQRAFQWAKIRQTCRLSATGLAEQPIGTRLSPGREPIHAEGGRCATMLSRSLYADQYPYRPGRTAPAGRPAGAALLRNGFRPAHPRGKDAGIASHAGAGRRGSRPLARGGAPRRRAAARRPCRGGLRPGAL